jgi:hypothetical protein
LLIVAKVEHAPVIRIIGKKEKSPHMNNIKTSPVPSFPPFHLLLIIYYLLPITSLPAQTTSSQYLIPQVVYVGDKGVLVIPLENSILESKAFDSVIEAPARTEDIIVHRVTMERHGEKAQLLVEFTAYRTGIIDIPLIQIPGFSAFDNLGTGLTVLISSVLDNSLSLSMPASPMIVPGTAVFVGIASSVVILSLLLALGVLVFWRKQFQTIRQSLMRRYLIFHIRRFVFSLWNEDDKSVIPDLLSAELRLFLSRFFEVDCFAMSAAEFASLPKTAAPAPNPSLSVLDAGLFLTSLFRHLDEQRFNPRIPAKEEVFAILNEVVTFIDALRGALQIEQAGKSEASV